MDIMTSIQNTMKQESRNLLKAYDSLENEAVEAVVKLLSSCTGKVIFSACGTSGMAAKKIAHTLNVVDQPAVFMNPADATHGGLGVLQPQDVLVLITKGGETGELIPIEQVARAKHLKVIVVTENKDSEIARNSDCVLAIESGCEPDQFNMMATGSTLAVISVFDAISILISKDKGFSPEDLALIHPGGAVGRKLNGLRPC